MHCPYCGNKASEVVETRDSCDLDTIRRRRSCLGCGKRFTTYERVENLQLVVIKKSGRREHFNREKLRIGLMKACDKTIIPVEVIEKIVTDITRQVRNLDGIEIESKLIGELVAKQLKQLDKVAYIRFASVFKRFVDVEDFQKEVREVKRVTP